MKDRIRTATIYDVAEHAGVSAATVSRVINHPDQVKYSTKTRVIDSMKALGFDIDYYKETSFDRGTKISPLPRIKKEMIFVISVPFLSNDFFTEIIKGAETAARKDGHHLLIDNTHIDENGFLSYCTLLKKHGISGLITTSILSTTLLTELQKLFPLVQCSEYNSELSSVSYVGIDDMDASYRTVKYFLDKGQTRIAYITTPLTHQFSLRRQRGYLKALAEARIPVNPDWILEMSDMDIRHCIHIIVKWLRHNRPDILICGADFYAAAALSASRELNIQVPRDLSIVGFDDIPIATSSIPSLSTVRQPRYQMGYLAFETLLKESLKPDSTRKHIFLPTELILRDSSI